MGFIKYVFQVSRIANGQDPEEEKEEKEKKEKKDDKTVSSYTIVVCSYVVGIVLILCAMCQFVLTLLLPVARSASAATIYTRNWSSIVCFAALGIFLISWCYQIIRQTNGDGEVKKSSTLLFKTVTVITFILSLIKGVFSTGLIYYLMYKPYYVLLYYASDAMVWLATAFYLFETYRISFVHKKSRTDGDKLRKLGKVLTAVSIIKALVSLLYTMMKFDTRYLPWIFFAADTLAWLALAFYFSFYSISETVVAIQKESKKRREENAELDKLFDSVAKKASDKPKERREEPIYGGTPIYWEMPMHREHRHRHEPISIKKEISFDKLPIGMQDFRCIREEGFRYVDKTEQMYNLTNGGKYYLLSRPRRFGKSLLLSTLKAFYEGKRELFEGLAITRHEDVDWTEHPVLYIDLQNEEFKKESDLEEKLNGILSQFEKEYGADDYNHTLSSRFAGAIKRACQQTGKRTVVLIDEYDKPILDTIGKPELQELFRSTLLAFYCVLKSMDGSIEFAMLTGATRFGQQSAFSGLNNLTDISMSERFNDICGFTEKEILDNFGQNIQVMADKNGMRYDECVGKLKRMYDGYHFHQKGEGIFNPFSILNAFASYGFGSYWIESGTPEGLVSMLQEQDYNLEQMSHESVPSDQISSIDAENGNPIPALYQSGYLTIKEYDKEFDEYTLGFPNREVEQGFVKSLVPYYLPSQKARSAFNIKMFVKEVEAGNTEQFVDRLRTIFADTPQDHTKDLENHCQNILWILHKLMGYYTRTEYKTGSDRIDMAVKTQHYCYAMEFRLDGTAQEDYMVPFSTDGLKVVKIGMNFSKETREIDKLVVE